MPITRTAYYAQTGRITTPNGTYLLPISSANVEVSSPVEAVLSFGQFGSLNQAQANLTTCKSSWKMHMGSGVNITGISATVLNDLINCTLTGSPFTVAVGPGGFTMTGILDSLALDISMGGLGMCDLGFAGIGHPYISPPTNQGTAVSTTYSISPISTMSISTGAGALSGVFASSLKFSYSLPTDVLSALGDNPDAFQGNMASQIASKAPYKATFSIDGVGVDPTTIATGLAGLAYNIGDISVTLPHAKIISRGFTNAAGQVAATFSYTLEDTSATLGTVALAAYADVNTSMGVTPTYGA